jgi:glutamate synthase (NADPH/NADH) large chain
LGLAETHQTLVKNKLRSRIVVQADGQIRTGRDLAMAALLGAEEWGVATAALVTVGCIMMRKCHLNTCPVGVATQNEELRALFTGKPEDVVNLFTFLAMELRETMAELGFRTVNEMVGQSNRLEMRDNIRHWKHKNLDLSAVVYRPPVTLEVGLYNQEDQDHGIADVLDWTLIQTAQAALQAGEKVQAEFKIQNINRTLGTMLSHEISKKYGGEGLPHDTIHFKFRGTAGQSFGAFGAKGLTLELEGDTNDYFGKGLSGARLILYPDRTATFEPSANSIVGNVAFYGATSGEAYIRGMAGERFGVRNSGVKAVVEGIGHHGCEYMTGGLVVILGAVGRNFAAGMSGGVAYIWNKSGDFEKNLNKEMVSLEELTQEDEEIIRMYVKNHAQFTNSAVAKVVLDNWEEVITQFVKVMPNDFKKALERKNIRLSEQIHNKEIVYA